MARYEIFTDGLTLTSRFSRRYAVLDTHQLDRAGFPVAVLQTDDARRAREYAEECEAQWQEVVYRDERDGVA